MSILMQTEARLFVLVGKLTTKQAGEAFLRWREKIVATALDESGAFIAKIRRDGVYMWLRQEDWRPRGR